MQEVFIVKLGLDGLTPTALVEKGRALEQGCTGNADVTLPAGFLPSLGDACTALEVANIAVRDNGGRQDRLVRAERKRDLEALIRELAGYVQAQCGDDQEKITRTGFETRKRPTPPERLPAVGNVRAAVSAYPGTIDVRWGGVAKRLLYELWYTTDPNDAASWTLLVMTSKNRHTAEGLTSNTVYYFRVVAIGVAGASPVSDSANAKAA